MTTWRSKAEPALDPIPAIGWVRVIYRGGLLGLILIIGVAVSLVIRIFERPLFGLRRPLTPFITQIVCRSAFLILGIGFRSKGTMMQDAGAIVANHSSWLDIFALNANGRIYFVSKSEVAGWPGIGLLAKVTGTVFIARDSRQAHDQKQVFESRLIAGHKLLFFPEGTSTDGSLVLPFKSTLFAAFLTPQLRENLKIQPVSVRYFAPDGQDQHFYGWWGDMGFGPHLLKVLAAQKQGNVEVSFHTPLSVADFANRKELARECEMAVRSVFDAVDVD